MKYLKDIHRYAQIEKRGVHDFALCTMSHIYTYIHKYTLTQTNTHRDKQRKRDRQREERDLLLHVGYLFL